MRALTPVCLAMLAGLPAACGQSEFRQPDTRQFEIRVDDEFYTVTETRKGGLFGGDKVAARTVRVNGRDVPCPDLPCTTEIRAARGAAEAGMEEFRKPPPGADLTTQ